MLGSVDLSLSLSDSIVFLYHAGGDPVLPDVAIARHNFTKQMLLNKRTAHASYSDAHRLNGPFEGCRRQA